MKLCIKSLLVGTVEDRALSRSAWLILLASFIYSNANAISENAPTVPPPPSLKQMPLPKIVETLSGLPLESAQPDGAGGFIKDNDAAIALGKALFYDIQMGSDGVSCATCHFHAGADSRTRNQISPGLNGGNNTFDSTATGSPALPNVLLKPGDYPFHKLADPADRDSAVLYDTDDVTSSQGTFAANFNDIRPGNRFDDCTDIVPDPKGFRRSGFNTRRVEPRNTPTIINAAFNDRNFWDGRANNIFNGVDPFGLRNVNARIMEDNGGGATQIQVGFLNSSLASQAVGPFLSDFEMSCGGRTFPKLGKKMLTLTPLAKQKVHPTDSVLGGLAAPDKGLATTYEAMIQAAFADRFWDSNALVDINQNVIGSGAPGNTDQYNLLESNFAFFVGLAVQAWERTQISDDSPFDRFQEGDTSAMTADQLAGADLFFINKKNERGLCITCHQGPLFSNATFPFTEDPFTAEGQAIQEAGEFPSVRQRVDRMKMGDSISINEDLFRYFLRGEGIVGGITVSGHVGARELPDIYPATVGGTLNIDGCDYTPISFLTNQDADPWTRDIDMMVRSSGCGPNLDVQFIDGWGPVNPVDYFKISIKGYTVYEGTLAAGDFNFNHATLYDSAYYNIGVRPTHEDRGIAGLDPWGNPLSYTQQWINETVLGGTAPDNFSVNPARFVKAFNYYGDGVFFPGGLDGPTWPVAIFPGSPVIGFVTGYGKEAIPANNPDNAQAIADMPLGIEGAFKTPGLRNVELTGPYFHNGGQATLKQVMEFYNRGGDFAEENIDSISPNIHPLNLSDPDLDLLVAFMKALTDERVRCKQAPFDHPELPLINGHQARWGTVQGNADGTAKDRIRVLPAVGAGGLPAAGQPCLKGFLE